MKLVEIHSIWHRQITDGDFFNIERSRDAGPSGGGGQTYIDIPDSVRVGLFTMLGLVAPSDTESGHWPSGNINAQVLGNLEESGTLSFEVNRRKEKRYRVSNQNRQAAGANRHPAWTARNGFPSAPDDVAKPQDAAVFLGQGARIFIVKSVGGDYYAGFTRGPVMPDAWPRRAGLEGLFGNGSIGGLIVPRGVPGYPPVVKRVFDAWQNKPNVLLYGPPGTGKTYVMSCILEFVRSWEGIPVIMLDPSDKEHPFRVVFELPMPSPVAHSWVSFHQSYGYEDFVVGLRPMVNEEGSGFTLRPRAGRLLELAVRVSLDKFEEQSAVLLVDELNRGNTSRIFGEFITFMDEIYRDVDRRGDSNPIRLPVPLASVNAEGDLTEPIEMASGGEFILPVPWHFPRHVYTLASMNSIDRTAGPLDSALSRRYERIDMIPDLGELEQWLDVDFADAVKKVSDAGNGLADLTPSECGVLILDRLNFQLATTLGPDFEMGHTYYMPLSQSADDDDGFRRLAQIWDRGIMPQLQERFLTRQEELIRILRVDDEVPDGYAFRRRVGMFGQSGGDRAVLQSVSMVSLAEQDVDRVRVTFRYMASRL